VVSFLDELFTRFEELAATSGVEKIKTIGDSYMAVAGAPEPRADHASAAMALAGGMMTAVDTQASSAGAGTGRFERGPARRRLSYASSTSANASRTAARPPGGPMVWCHCRE
jgi:class 3 adenylate cyclase